MYKPPIYLLLYPLPRPVARGGTGERSPSFTPEEGNTLSESKKKKKKKMKGMKGKNERKKEKREKDTFKSNFS